MSPVGRPEGATASHLTGERLRRWAPRGAVAVLDQAAYAATGFLTTALLARILDEAQYAAFALAYSILALIVSAHGAAIVEPMLVLAPSRYATRTRGYVARVASVHFAVTLAVGLIVCLAGGLLGLLGHPARAHAFLGLGLALPALLVVWVVRRAFLAHGDARGQAAVSLVYLVLAVAALGALFMLRASNGGLAFVALGLCGLLTALLFRARLNRMGTTQVPPSFREVLRAHWGYGAWLQAALVVGWASGNIHYYVLSSTLGDTAVAGMRAIDTVLMPLWQILAALGTVLLPSLARVMGTPRVGRLVVEVAALFLGVGLVSAAVLAGLGRSILTLVCGARYAEFDATLALFSIALPFETTASFLLAVLRAAGRTRVIFGYYLLLAIAVPLGYVLVARVTANWSLDALIVARVLASVALTLGLVVAVALATRTRHPGP